MNPETFQITAFAAITSLLIASTGWFLKRALQEVKELGGEIKKMVGHMSQHTTAIAVIEAKHSQLSNDVLLLRSNYIDLVGFMRDQGYRKRDGRGV